MASEGLTNAEYIAKAAAQYATLNSASVTHVDTEKRSITIGKVTPVFDSTLSFAFLAGAKAQLQSPLVQALVEALEYYANHESVIKEAYHTGASENQIRVVHTFINHRAIEALAAYRESLK